MLLKILKDVLFARSSSTAAFAHKVVMDQGLADEVTSFARRVLNVGGNSKAIPIPGYYDGWEHLLLDIDPSGSPDIVCDSRSLCSLQPHQFDAIYCSHNLEHYFQHDVAKVLAGFRHVLIDHGFVDIRVPDMASLMKQVVEKELDIEDFLYQSPAGPIHVIDVIYGWRKEIEQSGNDFFAHKTGFTEKSLATALQNAGFDSIHTATLNLEVRAIAFKLGGAEFDRDLLNLGSGIWKSW